MENIEFDNQRPHEEVVLLRKRHPWVLWRSGFFIIILGIIVFLAFLFFGASKISAITTIVALIIGAYHLAVKFFVYNNDIFIITDQRIINIDQRGFFSRKVSETELENIQNVAYEVKGPIRSMLNFGEVIISTAGNTVGLTLANVENPHFIQEKIVEQGKRSRTKEPVKESPVMR